MKSIEELASEVYKATGIMLPKEDPIWAFYEVLARNEEEFLQKIAETYRDVSAEISKDLRSSSDEYCKSLIESSRLSAEAIRDSLSKFNADELKAVIQEATAKQVAPDPVKVVKQIEQGDNSKYLRQLFYANVGILFLHLFIFLVSVRM